MSKTILFMEATRNGVVGGSHLCLLEIVKSLSERGYDLLVVFRSSFPLQKQFEAYCRVIIVPKKDPLPLKSDDGTQPRTGIRGIVSWIIRDVLQGAYQLKKIIAQENVDLVHLNNHIGFDLDGTLAAKLSGIPCVVHERGFLKVYRAARFMASYIDAVVCISGAVQTFYEAEKFNPTRLVKIYDGIDIGAIDPHPQVLKLREQLGIPSDVPTVGVFGSLQEWKGQKEVIAAIGQIVEAFPTIMCLVVGPSFDDTYASDLKRMVEKEGLLGHVKILGYQKNVLEIMGAMDLVIHASILPEPMGRVLLEAMCSSKPVIATAAGGPLEIVEDGVTGVLVPPGDVDGMVKALKRLLEDKALCVRMGQAGRKRVEEKFPLHKMVGELETLYATLI